MVVLCASLFGGSFFCAIGYRYVLRVAHGYFDRIAATVASGNMGRNIVHKTLYHDAIATGMDDTIL